MRWPEEIAKLVLIKQALAEADKKRLWPYHLPSVAATTSMLAEAEAALNLRLDSQYAAFLLYADGWKGLFQTVDLFGTQDLIGSASMTAAMDLARAIDEEVLASAGATRTELLPIAATSQDMDLFALTLPGATNPGEVLWFAGGLIERFTNFNEYFLSMVDYNRAEVRRMMQ